MGDWQARSPARKIRGGDFEFIYDILRNLVGCGVMIGLIAFCIIFFYIISGCDCCYASRMIHFDVCVMVVLLIYGCLSVSDGLLCVGMYTGCADNDIVAVGGAWAWFVYYARLAADYEFVGIGYCYYRFSRHSCMLDIFHRWGCLVVYSTVVGSAPDLRSLPCVLGRLVLVGGSVDSSYNICRDVFLICLSCAFCLLRGILVYHDV